MSDTHGNDVVSGLLGERDISRIREAVCVQVEKIYDSCAERDCIEDAKVLFLSPAVAQRAINVKCRKAEIIDVVTDIEPVPFKRGFFTVDIKFFIKVTLDILTPTGFVTPSPQGLVLFDKKVILFGSEGAIKIFKSHFREDAMDVKEKSTLQQDNLPIAKVEVAEPICLNARIQSVEDKLFDDCCKKDHLPKKVARHFEDYDDNVEAAGTGLPQRIVVTIGLFSIIKLARFVQLRVPVFGFCVPKKECVASREENPCELFEEIDFPVDEFFPPQICDFPGAAEEEKKLFDKHS